MQKKLDVRIFRETHGYTQESLAKALDISRNYVYLVEAGKKPLSNKLQRKLERLEFFGNPHAPGAPASGGPGIIAEGASEGYGKPDNWTELFKRLERIETDIALVKKLLAK